MVLEGCTKIFPRGCTCRILFFCTCNCSAAWVSIHGTTSYLCAQVKMVMFCCEISRFQIKFKCTFCERWGFGGVLLDSIIFKSPGGASAPLAPRAGDHACSWDDERQNMCSDDAAQSTKEGLLLLSWLTWHRWQYVVLLDTAPLKYPAKLLMQKQFVLCYIWHVPRLLTFIT